MRRLDVVALGGWRANPSRVTGHPLRGRTRKAPQPMTERLALSVAEVQAALGIGRRQAYALARRIGVRISERRLVVPVARLEDFLAGGSEPPTARAP